MQTGRKGFGQEDLPSTYRAQDRDRTSASQPHPTAHQSSLLSHNHPNSLALPLVDPIHHTRNDLKLIYLENDHETCIPNTFPLHVGQIEWCVQWPASLGSFGKQLRMLGIERQKSCGAITLLRRCHLIAKPECRNTRYGQ